MHFILINTQILWDFYRVYYFYGLSAVLCTLYGRNFSGFLLHVNQLFYTFFIVFLFKWCWHVFIWSQSLVHIHFGSFLLCYEFYGFFMILFFLFLFVFFGLETAFQFRIRSELIVFVIFSLFSFSVYFVAVLFYFSVGV